MSLSIRLLSRLQGWLLGGRFDRCAKDPRAAQEALREQILKSRANTVFGKEHGFASIRNAADWAARIPVRDYEGFRPYIDRMLGGETDVLVPGDALMYATTSGTTCLPKLVPVTPDFKKDISRLTSLWVARCQRDHPGTLRHGIFTMVSPAVEGYAASGQPIGSVSGLTRARMPWFIRRAYCNPTEVTEISNYDLRYFVAMRMSLARSVSVMVTPNPTTLLRLAEVGAEHAPQLIRAIHDGEIGARLDQVNSEEAEVQARIARSLSVGLRPDPQRARFLEDILKKHGRLRPRDAWPDLAVIGCWLGGSAGTQAEWLEDWYGDVPRRDLGLRATEATMTVPMTDGTPFGVPALGTVLFEFSPEDAIDEEHPPVKMVHELEQGKRYYILLTTRGGLYRYDINDVVEVQGTYLGTPLIAFVRKGRDMANITGEKLHVNQVMAAATDASRATGLDWTQIRVIPDLECARYDLLIEPRRPGTEMALMERFSKSFDQALTLHNEEWGGKRKSRRLHLPIVHEMKAGWYERTMRANMEASGKRDSQYKWKMIAPEWDESSRSELLKRQPDSATYLMSLQDLDLGTGTGSVPSMDRLEGPETEQPEE
ncbi:MAG: GH3 auxin-responsive promoter family protein [Myxococcota bacterium]|nr:GH3 auxin-responsive promoter family protein [Myxococcota bacterium]